MVQTASSRPESDLRRSPDQGLPEHADSDRRWVDLRREMALIGEREQRVAKQTRERRRRGQELEGVSLTNLEALDPTFVGTNRNEPNPIHLASEPPTHSALHVDNHPAIVGRRNPPDVVREPLPRVVRSAAKGSYKLALVKELFELLAKRCRRWDRRARGRYRARLV